MVDNKTYDLLLNEHNILVSKYNDLQDQIATQKKHWKEKEEILTFRDKNIRELCTEILSKDRDEMKLGGSGYAWFKLSTDELIQKARDSYEKYNTRRNELMQKLMDMADERAGEIEDLQNQIARMINSQQSTPTEGEPDNNQSSDEQQYDDGVQPDVADNSTNQTPKSNESSIEKDIIPQELELISTAAQDGAIVTYGKIKPTVSSIPFNSSEKKVNAVEKGAKKAQEKIYGNLSAISSKISDIGWAILSLFGKEGVSRYTILAKKMQENYPDITESKIRTTLASLTKSGLITSERVNNPFVKNLLVYYLDTNGELIFTQKFKQKPVPSEKDRIIAEHDNLEHGYGIEFLAEVMRMDATYKDVCTFNRRKAIPISGKITYVPDVKYQYNGKNTQYIEYECANHTQADFNAKCNKMLQVTRFLDFVTPNQDALNHLKSQVSNWIEAAGVQKLKSIKIRLCTGSYFKDNLVNQPQKIWQIEYTFADGKVNLKE